MQNSTPFFLFLLLLSLLIFSTAQPGFSDPPSAACKSTLYPKLCRSILSSFRRSRPDSAAYGEFSVNQCINHATTLSATITRFLRHPMLVSAREVSALDDCAHLVELTVDYLRLAAAELRAADNRSTTDAIVGRVETLLSAVVTNQQTCHDGLADAGSKIVDALHVPLSNASQLYSVTLGLVRHALGRRRNVAAGALGHRPRGMLEAFDWARNPSFVATKVLESSEREGRMVEEWWEKLGVKVRGVVKVSRDGGLGFNFTSIGEAIAYAPNKTNIKDGYFVIYAKEGYYEENVVVGKHKKNIMLIGDGINRTVIVGNRSVADGWTTYKSATFAVYGERFLAIDVTLRNTAGPGKHQAVALRNNADLSAFYRCSFEGYQDTLYTHSLRQFYRDCDVYGTVDFVFGNAAAILQNCNLYARRPLPNQKNIFTAQGRTDPNQNTGISIHNCTVQAAADLTEGLNLTHSFLGRPWKVYSRTVFMQSYIGDLIDPAGWLAWDGTVGLDTVYYGEFENYGGGANTSMRVQWPGYSVMNASQAVNFTVYNFTMGDTWLNYTNIPFSQGLL